jgi:hypothetical protein
MNIVPSLIIRDGNSECCFNVSDTWDKDTSSVCLAWFNLDSLRHSCLFSETTSCNLWESWFLWCMRTATYNCNIVRGFNTTNFNQTCSWTLVPSLGIDLSPACLATCLFSDIFSSSSKTAVLCSFWHLFFIVCRATYFSLLMYLHGVASLLF